MLSLISKRFTDFFLKKQIIDEEKYEISEYGFMITLSSLFCILSILIISVICGMIVEGITFLIVFMAIRTSCGGYHCSTYLKCWLFTNSIFLVYLAIIYFTKDLNVDIVSMVLLALCSLIIVAFAPLINENNPKGEKEIAEKKIKARIILSCYIVIFGVFFVFFRELNIHYFISLSITAVTILMLITIIKEGKRCLRS